MSSEQLRITIGAGGAGGAVMGAGLVEAFPDADVSIVVTTGDSGSKTGELRQLFGGPAVGDIRNILSAVSGNGAGPMFNHRFGREDSPETVRRLAAGMLGVIATEDTTRLDAIMERTITLSRQLPDGLAGHTFGNLVLTALSQSHGGNLTPAVREAGTWLAARAQVIPVTDEPHDLLMLDNGRLLHGEGVIDVHTVADTHSARVWLENERGQKPQATEEAATAIEKSDVFLLGPGSIFTSLLPVLAVDGVAKAIANQQHGGSFVAVANLVAEDHTATGLDLADYTKLLENQADRQFDYVIYNHTEEGLPPGKVPIRYHSSHFDGFNTRAIGANLVGLVLSRFDANDPISHLRSPVRHNVRAVAQVLRSHVLPPMQQTSYNASGGL
ncbi:MAG: gluconeogenesis factor YvcK family protein [Candidatus Saccharimonadales bacterium]